MLRGDDKQFQADVLKAGDTAGGSFGQRFASKFKSAFTVGNLLGGLGAAGGALFAIAAKGGAEMADAAARYRSETGASIEETNVFSATLSQLNQDNVQGIGEIAAALTSVKVNLGLTGDAAKVATQLVLDFSKVTGQDAVDAVGALDDLTDGYNLTAGQQVDILNKLVKSHELYGGSVTESQAALVALAPALTAANLTYDDGIGLLNMFAAAGVDAAAAPAALTKALSKVKSPEELQALIDDISATEDPFLRASKAADLFGPKAGAKLAQALSKGKLSDFTLTVEETATALHDATEAADSRPFAILQKILKKLTGPLADVGREFGPVILAFTQLGGGKLIGAVVTGLGALAGKALPALISSLVGLVPALAGVLGTIGTAIGGLIAAAIPIGMALLPVLLVAALIAAVAFLIANPELLAEILKVAGEIVSGIVNGLVGIGQALLDIFVRAFGNIIGAVGPFVSGVVTAILSIPGKVVAWVADLVGQAGRFAKDALGKITAFVGSVVAAIIAIPGKVAQWAVDLLAQVGRFATEGLAKIVGLAAGVVREILSIPGRVVAWVGALALQAVLLGIRFLSTIVNLVGDVVRWVLSIPGKLVGLVLAALRLGQNFVKGFINGLASFPGKLANLLADAISRISIDIGPFHLDRHGFRIDLPQFPWENSGGGASGGGFATGSWDIPQDQIALIHKGEMIVPEWAATAVRSGQMSIGPTGSGGGNTYQITVPVQGLLRAETPEDVARPLRRLASLGELAGLAPTLRTRTTG